MNPVRKCNTCTSASDCQAKQKVSDCPLTKVTDLFGTAAEPVKGFWTAIMAQPGATASFDNTTNYSECFTIQFQAADKSAGELRSCSPPKLGAVGFCDAINAAANTTKAKIILCKTCAVAEKPCNNEPPLIKPVTTTGKPAPSSAFLMENFPIFNIYHCLVVVLAAKFII